MLDNDQVYYVTFIISIIRLGGYYNFDGKKYLYGIYELVYRLSYRQKDEYLAHYVVPTVW